MDGMQERERRAAALKPRGNTQSGYECESRVGDGGFGRKTRLQKEMYGAQSLSRDMRDRWTNPP